MTSTDHPGRPAWGTAMTAVGSLGVAPRSDWAGWVDDERLPPSLDGSGFGVDFASDLQLLADQGLRQLRWGLDWARLEPFQNRWDDDAADLVTEVLRAARVAGVDVWAVLHEGPLPGWFSEDQRGFGDDEGLGLTWPRHVDRVAERFGDLVAGWVPVLDPYTQADRGFLTGTRPPGRTDPKGFTDALRRLHLAGLNAWKLLASGEAPVAACLDVAPIHAGVQSREPDERDAARTRAAGLDRLRWGIGIQALSDGVLGVPGHGEVEIPGLAGAYDLVGFTYRGGVTVFADGSTGPYPADATVAADGRAPWPEGLGVVVRRLAAELPGRRLGLLGTGLTADEDDWRSDVVGAVALEVERAVDDGVPIDLAFWESGIDGWTPETGLDVPDGIIDRARHPRPSAQVLAAAATRARLRG